HQGQITTFFIRDPPPHHPTRRSPGRPHRIPSRRWSSSREGAAGHQQPGFQPPATPAPPAAPGHLTRTTTRLRRPLGGPLARPLGRRTLEWADCSRSCLPPIINLRPLATSCLPPITDLW